MTLKPPTRTLPKVVMKEWPGATPVYDTPKWPGPPDFLNGNARITPPDYLNPKALSDFTRVVEETGILDQEETPLRKRD